MTQMIPKLGRISDSWRSVCPHMTSTVSPTGERRVKWGYGEHFNWKAEEETRSLSGVSPPSAFFGFKEPFLLPS